jgi:uncharacterized protein YkwD
MRWIRRTTLLAATAAVVVLAAQQLHQSWMGSPLHRANTLGNFTVVGIGVACNGSKVYATEDFGR